MNPDAAVARRGRPLTEAAHGSAPVRRGLAGTAANVVEQVEDLLVVELHELSGHLELGRGEAGLFGLGLAGVDAVKQLTHRPRDDPDGGLRGRGQLKSGSHRVGLSTSGLSIRQDGCIVPETIKAKNG